MPREISAFSNPLVKRVRSLRDKKHRREEGLFMAEGLRILAEAREAGHLPALDRHVPEGLRPDRSVACGGRRGDRRAGGGAEQEREKADHSGSTATRRAGSLSPPAATG